MAVMLVTGSERGEMEGKLWQSDKPRRFVI